MSNKRLVYNTALLTVSGLLMSGISMLFRIWLAGKIGAEGMGLYQLVGSVTVLGATFAVSGIRFAATRLVSEELGLDREGGAVAALRRCFAYALFFGFSAGAILYLCAEPVGFLWVGDARTVRALKISAFSMPMIALSSVMSGWFTAVGRVWKPTLVHFLEQLAGVGLVMLLLSRADTGDIEASCAAVLLGTACADAVSLFLMSLFYSTDRGDAIPKAVPRLSGRLLRIALPLALSAYARSALSTLQHLIVPRGLRAAGLSAELALADYGTLSGMALPILLFPACLLTALAELIVPELTEAQMKNDHAALRKLCTGAIKKGTAYSVAVALFMFFFADKLGTVVFSSLEAARFIRVLAPLVPVMYTDTVIDGCLKGLGQQLWCMCVNILDAFLGVLLTWLLLPKYAMDGYVIMIYVSESVNFALSAFRLVQMMPARTKNSSTKVMSTAAAKIV